MLYCPNKSCWRSTAAKSLHITPTFKILFLENSFMKDKNKTYANGIVMPKERKLLKDYLKESLFLSKSVNGLPL
jgi:hypothetical protein